MTEINFNIPKGKYVVAVSGGVDSVVLLNLLNKDTNLDLTVAHFDHGIRDDSFIDRELVEKIARKDNLEFVFLEGKLSKKPSENEAREARYEFLYEVLKSTKSKAIITAHHQDDLIETAIFNIFRGTGRKGLASLNSTDKIIRPLLNIPKKNIYEYARSHKLEWREDPTNQDTAISRNHIRHNVIPKLSDAKRRELLVIIDRTGKLNKLIDSDILSLLENDSDTKLIDRDLFISLPHAVAKETMTTWLRQNSVRDFNSKLIEKLTIAAKTYKNGQKMDVNNEYFLYINKGKLALTERDR
jgi:tRNA(Ile)-lysidine synthetase-like protein